MPLLSVLYSRWGLKEILLYNILLIFAVTEINLLFLTGIYYLFNFKVSLSGLGLELLTNPVFNILAMFVIFPVLRAGRNERKRLDSFTKIRLKIITYFLLILMAGLFVRLYFLQVMTGELYASQPSKVCCVQRTCLRQGAISMTATANCW